MKKFHSSYNEYIKFIRSLSHKISRKYYGNYLTYHDYVQIGLIALWKACEGWQADKGEFGPYVCASIHHEINNEAIKSTGPLHAPFVDKVLALKIKNCLNNGITEEEVIQLLGISRQRMEELKRISMSINEIYHDFQGQECAIDLLEIDDRLSKEEMDLFLTDETTKNRTEKCRMFKKIKGKLSA